MKKNIFVIGLVLLFFSCGNSTEENKAKHKVAQAKSEDSSKSIMDLLQGKWQSQEDESNVVEFKSNLRLEIAAGMSDWDKEEFILSDKCVNDMDKDSGIENDKDKYISCIKSDLCWHIDKIDADNLVLTFIGRGNSLSYKRTK